jgi:hypothetical protein
LWLGFDFIGFGYWNVLELKYQICNRAGYSGTGCGAAEMVPACGIIDK